MQVEADTQIVSPPGQGSEGARDAPPRGAGVGDRELGAARRWVGRYELIHRLAHGGMATVYLARAKGKAGFEKVVAVKIIHAHLASESQFVRMFLDEARIAARLHHPHVVEILDLGEVEGVHFMVMEFIEGDNLSALVRALDGEQLPLSVILCLLSDTLEGLGAAHDLRDVEGDLYRLVHRDVSPHNILINLDGWAKVGDFGIMKAAGKTSNTRTGELRGKLAYMSPEQARGTDLDLRTDLFAVGVITWELLTGRRLFACESDAATLERVIACRVPDIDFGPEGDRSELAEAPELVEGLKNLIARSLAADPQERFGSAGEMLGEVRRLARLAEDLEDSPEPRNYLGALMTRFFKTRVDYARAALRRTGEYEALGLALASESSSSGRWAGERRRSPSGGWAVEPTVKVGQGRGAVSHGDATALVERGTPTQTPPPVLPTGSHPSLVAPTGGSWAQWVILPMLGAAIAVAAMMVINPPKRDADRPVEPPRGEVEPGEEAPRERLPPATEYAPPPAREVQWQFTSQPEGATVTVNGEVWDEPTPTTITLPAGNEAVEVELSLPGHRSQVLRPKPLSDQNFDRRLEPLPGSDSGDKGEGSKRPRPTKKVGKTKDPAGSTDGGPFLPPPDELTKGK